MPEGIYIAVFVIGLIINIVGAIWLLVRMFMESVWWGLGGIFCSPVSLIYLFSHFEDAWKPYLTSFIGSMIMLFGMFSSPDLRSSYFDTYDTDGTYMHESSESDFSSDWETMGDVPEEGGDPAMAPAEPQMDPEEYRRQQEKALRERQARYGTFTLAEVLDIDPATLTTAEQLKRYQDGLRLKKQDLVDRRRSLDTSDTQAVRQLQREVGLLKRRTGEFKKAVETFKRDGPPRDNGAGEDDALLDSTGDYY